MKFFLFLIIFISNYTIAQTNCDADFLILKRNAISKIIGNIQLQRALENAAKTTNTIIIGRSMNPTSYGMLYEGALGKTMDIKAKSSLDPNLDGTIPKNPYLGKNKNKLQKIDLEISNLKNNSTNSKVDNLEILKNLKKEKDKIMNFGNQIFVPKTRGTNTLVYKIETKDTSTPLTEYVTSTKDRDIVYVLGGINSNGEKSYFTADLDLYALLEFGASYSRDKFVENFGFVYEKMPQQILKIQEAFTEIGFLPTSKIVNHGDEMGYGKNVTKEMLLSSDPQLFPMHATDTNHQYTLIRDLKDLKELFKRAKESGYGVEGWAPQAMHQRNIILGN